MQLRERLDAIASDLGILEADVGSASRSETSPKSSTSVTASRADSDARAHAVAARKRIVAAIESAGVSMSRVSEAVYRTSSGSRVAMPFSSQLYPGKWWLGSYIGRFDEVLLLCDRGSRVEAFHLDNEFVREHTPRMSRDSNGNVKFNVDRVGAEFKLRLGKGRTIDLRRFDPASHAGDLGR